MAQDAVRNRNVSVRFACQLFVVSESCYRYQPHLNEENDLIADWLIRITDSQRNWGFGLCFLYLRNVKGFRFNHKRVYRIYCELSLNMRIKPKKRLKRDKPEPLVVPENRNECWSMDFMHDGVSLDIENYCTLRLIFVQPIINGALVPQLRKAAVCQIQNPVCRGYGFRAMGYQQDRKPQLT